MESLREHNEIRDAFAAAAMTGLISGGIFIVPPDTTMGATGLADTAYEIAVAMMNARAKLLRDEENARRGPERAVRTAAEAPLHAGFVVEAIAVIEKRDELDDGTMSNEWIDKAHELAERWNLDPADIYDYLAEVEAAVVTEEATT